MSVTTYHERQRRVKGKLFELVCLLATLFCILVLAVLLSAVVYRAWGWLDWDFLTHFASRKPEKAGVKAALVGSVLLISLTAFFTVTIGTATAVYLEEYSGRNWIYRLVRFNIYNLAGVPSIVYGVLGLALFVRAMALGRSLLAGSLTLSLVILPIVIISAQEALRAVPSTIRQASYALGATRWQTVRHQVLPLATPGIMTGIILAMSRAMGEAAPLIMVGALGFVAFLPEGITDSFTALPIQIFNWTSRPQHEFHNVASAGILVLLMLLFCMNGLAIAIRYKFEKR